MADGERERERARESERARSTRWVEGTRARSWLVKGQSVVQLEAGRAPSAESNFASTRGNSPRALRRLPPSATHESGWLRGPSPVYWVVQPNRDVSRLIGVKTSLDGVARWNLTIIPRENLMFWKVEAIFNEIVLFCECVYSMECEV